MLFRSPGTYMVERQTGGAGRLITSSCPRSFPATQSDTVTAIVVPDGADAERVRDIAFRKFDLALGAGLGPLRGKVFRIGHLGDLNALMLLGALAGTEMTLADAGIPVTPGSGVAAAQAWYRA